MKAVVTGAGAGLGASIAERLASEGYAVALLDQDGDAASRSAEANRCERVSGDVSNPEQVADVFSRIGAVDLLVNNAGIAGLVLCLSNRQRICRPLSMSISWGRIMRAAGSETNDGARLGLHH